MKTLTLALLLVVVVSTKAPPQCPAPAWAAMDPGHPLNASVNAFCEWDPDGAGPQGPELVAAGGFNLAGTMPIAPQVATWNGTSWQPLGSGITNALVLSLYVYNGDLIAGRWLHHDRRVLREPRGAVERNGLGSLRAADSTASCTRSASTTASSWPEAPSAWSAAPSRITSRGGTARAGSPSGSVSAATSTRSRTSTATSSSGAASPNGSYDERRKVRAVERLGLGFTRRVWRDRLRLDCCITAS